MARLSQKMPEKQRALLVPVLMLTSPLIHLSKGELLRQQEEG